MSELHELPPFEHEDDTSDEQPAPPSVFEMLKAERARVARESHFDFVVPGWGDCLIIRLGSVTGQQQQRIFERMQKSGGNVERLNLDYVVASFQSLYVRRTPQAELELLVDDDGEPFGLDEHLAAKLELGPVTNARGVLLALFAGANSPTTALDLLGTQWMQWAREASSEVDESFLGE